MRFGQRDCSPGVMRENSGVSQAECIHGLEAGVCDVCNPPPAPVAPPRRAKTRTPAAAPPIRAGKPLPAVAVRNVAARRYLVVHRDRLAELLAAGPLTDESGWRSDLGAAGAFDPIRWEDARRAERAAELVVLVGSGTDPDHLELVAVANAPARTVVSAILTVAGRSPRLALNPAWFV